MVLLLCSSNIAGVFLLNAKEGENASDDIE